MLGFFSNYPLCLFGTVLSGKVTSPVPKLQEGYGIGDDEFSLAYDGCRRLIWYNARNEAQSRQSWHPGDVLGCLLDLNKPEVIFYINGAPLSPCTRIFNTAR
ncbi:RING finger and SPRY domain-containing protein 1 [Zootermopsis nevadensis]|uniref:RING finger and SPRY domain-containing protein 1 n=1 Tax=Zootermopsis nevadensis TaxID=136037 RepID=A0A067QSB8_ZOONE|nr:RING finger and SPRY domain-containing protein 1 [Zootermopsis nevadensis]